MAIIANGVCDKDKPQALWQLDDEGTLTIYGTEEVYIYFKMPWDEYAQNIRTFRVDRGITNVSVELKNYLNLQRVEFSDTVIYDFCSFKGCVNLSEIIVPDSVEHFEDRSIEDTAWYKSQPDGAVYIGKIFYGFKGGYSGGAEFTVKDGTKGITRGSFKVKGITKVNLPGSIDYVAQSNFTFDDDILNMSLRDIRRGYANWSFSGETLWLRHAGTKDFSNPDKQPWSGFRKKIRIVSADSVEYIGENAFAECTSLCEVKLNHVSVIGTNALKNCTALKSVMGTESIERIEKDAFSGCENLTEISVPHLTKISGAELVKFNKYHPVEYVPAPDLEKLKRRGCFVGGFGNNFSWALDKKGVMTFFGEGEMPYDGKFNCERGNFERWSVKKLILDDRITKIGDSAFREFTELTRIVFPKRLKIISRDAFRGCSSLREIVLPESTEIIRYGAFASCGMLQQISLPDGLKSIENGSFSDCNSLERVHLPDSVKNIGSCAFYSCEKLIDINIPENAEVEANILYDTLLAQNSPTEILYHDGWVLGYAREHSEKVLRFKKGTRKIAKMAFGSRDGEIDDDITEVVFDGDICEIGAFAFTNITSLEKVAADCTFKRLGVGIFWGTPWLKNQPEGVVYLANAVLAYNGKIPEKIKIGSEHNGRKITLIAPHCIPGYDKLRELEIGENIELIGYSAFSYSHILEKVTIPDSVKCIESTAFLQCEMLKRVFIPSSVEKIGVRAFGYYDNPDHKWGDPNSPYYLRVEGFTIICERGSAAEKYATDNGFRIEYV